MFQIDLSWFQINPSWLKIDPWVIALLIISVIAFLTIATIWGIRAHRHRVSAGKEELIGKAAEVKVALKPKGIVFIQGERWTAVLDNGQAKPGEEVLITKVDGLKLYVTKK